MLYSGREPCPSLCANNSQMSVRKAALGAACGLLRALPDQALLAALWVGAALPLVRDVEASLQEAALDAFAEFIIAPAGVRLPAGRSCLGSHACFHRTPLQALCGT